MRYLLYKYILRHFGYGNRVSKTVWEEQFGSDTWNYLTDEEEKIRYYSISRLLSKCKDGGKLLDVGCGQGMLYKYLGELSGISDSQYTGIDISENAVKAARQEFPGVNFRQLDFDEQGMDQKFDVIIFNETLYYFTRPVKTLERCIAENLNPGGAFIISMCDFLGHDDIWKQLTRHYKVSGEEEVVNKKEQKWKIKLLVPRLATTILATHSFSQAVEIFY